MTRLVAPAPVEPIAPGSPPTFTVVIPAYQAAGFIPDAIESVLAQTRPPIELIVCNDGSTDDLEQALAPYRDRLLLINKENGGEASAKNAGVRAASGEFVAILDADDVFLPRRLEALGELATARPDLDLLTSDAYMVVNDRRVRRCYEDGFRFEIDDQRRGILATNFFPAGLVAVRREAYLAVGGFDEELRRVPDWDCWLRMILAGSKAGMVDEPLAEYRLRTTNISTDRVRMFQGRVETLQKALRRDDLSADERRTAQRSLAASEAEVAIRSARAAVIAGTPGARRQCLSVLFGHGMSAGARLKAAAAAVAPHAAGRALARRDRSSTEVAGGIRVRLE